MVVRQGDLYSEVWERANGTWSFIVCPRENRSDEVDQAMDNLSWDFDRTFHRLVDGIKDKRKTWYRSHRECGTGEERAVRMARREMRTLRDQIEWDASERRRRDDAKRVSE